MLRASNVQTLPWADKTKSMLKARRLEVCDDILAARPDAGLFSGCTAANVEKLWAFSYDGLEHPHSAVLHTPAALQALVMTRLPAEAALLTLDEHLILERMLILDGVTPLMDYEEMETVLSLVRRMWCTLTYEGGEPVLHLPKELVLPLQQLLETPTHQEIREKLARFDLTMRSLLYVGGLLHVSVPMQRMMETVLKDTYAANEQLVMRYLKAAYDYTYTPGGDMLLLHPGLADPDRLLPRLRESLSNPASIPQETLLQAMHGLLPEEQPVFDRVFGTLIEAVRPEITPEEAAIDLLILAKQSVTLQEMNEVLGSLLTVQPTRAMLDAVQEMHMLTPRWGTMRTGMVQ